MDVYCLGSAWSKIKKCQHDKKAEDPKICQGNRALVYTPANQRVKAVLEYGVVTTYMIGWPGSLLLRVVLNHIRHCTREIADNPTKAVTGIELIDELLQDVDPPQLLEKNS